MMTETDIPTPAIVIDAAIVRRNLDRMAAYARSHGLGLRPHTKTHKSLRLAAMQIERGAIGLTVAKIGEAEVMAAATDDLLMAYPAINPNRAVDLARLAASRVIRVAIDSITALETLARAAAGAGTELGVLVDLDIGHHRTGVQSANEALALAQEIDRTPGLRFDGLLFYPGHLSHGSDAGSIEGLRTIDHRVTETLDLLKRHGIEAKIVSGGSTPTASNSHLIHLMTEFRPGTYVYNDFSSIASDCATIDDCSARIVCAVISTAVPGQIVLDSGSKTLTSDRCGTLPDSGFGLIVELPQAKVFKLNEEHAQVDVSRCDRVPKVGDRLTIIPNHICPCINLQDYFWWKESEGNLERLPVDARGKVF